jgi:hypothetical protein
VQPSEHKLLTGAHSREPDQGTLASDFTGYPQNTLKGFQTIFGAPVQKHFTTAFGNSF